ncbi:unnamed protein product, partial [Effrenium voratum]
PNSGACLVWDIVCLVVTMHDSVMIPLLSAFDLEPSLGLDVLAAASGVVWLLDLLFTF